MVNNTAIFLKLVYQSVFYIFNDKLFIRKWIEGEGVSMKSSFLVSHENDVFKEY